VGRQKVIVLTGPTASGKSALLYETLRHLPLTVINSDSRQVYRELKISSASPTPAEKSVFPHELYNFLPLEQAFSAGEFVRQAKTALVTAQAADRIPIICGGTYFYLHALLYGLLPTVEISESVRAEVEALSPRQAFIELEAIDPKAAATNHPNNLIRVRRALMLCRQLGGKISELAKTGGISESHDIQLVILNSPRDLLRERIRQRLESMLTQGLISEIQSVFAAAKHAAPNQDWRQIPALTGIGIREFFEYHDEHGRLPAELDATQQASVVAEIAQNTIHLVKRQQTWFNNANPKPANTKTVDPSYENARIASLVESFLS
jgi:tRNA dimethylallyltransferase